jgi:hypothetical protein
MLMLTDSRVPSKWRLTTDDDLAPFLSTDNTNRGGYTLFFSMISSMDSSLFQKSTSSAVICDFIN